MQKSVTWGSVLVAVFGAVIGAGFGTITFLLSILATGVGAWVGGKNLVPRHLTK